jgi:exopolysaccharide biosynthesis polyprenyl glycosylphosphotransferase
MAMMLAYIEATAVFGAVCATLVLWAPPLQADWTDSVGLVAQAIAFSLCYMVTSYYSDLYDLRIMRHFSGFIARLPRCIGILMILMVAGSSLIPQQRTGVELLAASLLNTIGLLLILRAGAYRILRSHPITERVLLFGAGPLADLLVREFWTLPHCIVLGVVEDADQIGKMMKEAHVDRIIIAVPERRGQLPFQQLVEARMKGIIIEDGAEVYERLTGKLAIELLTPSSLIFWKGFRKSRLHLAVIRGVSLLVTVVALVGVAPLFGLIALAIKLDSRGPIFCVQDRVGMAGKRFRLVKFRTMRPVDGDTGLWFKDNHNRITRVGRWIRKFHLDELPQFVNILQGDMNLVGPRPQRVPKFELLFLVSRNAPECGEPIPYYSLRSMVRPGITGWAQVRYRYATDLYEEIEKLRYDLYYIKHQSLWLDLRILFDTLRIVLLGRGSGSAYATRHQTTPSAVSPREHEYVQTRTARVAPRDRSRIMDSG